MAILRLLGLALLYQIFRLLFLLIHSASFQSIDADSIVHAFWVGTRFDLATLALLNLPYFLLTLLPGNRIALLPGFQRTFFYFFVITNFVLACFTIADLEYFRFTGSRLTTDIIYFGGEAAHQSLQFLWNFWYIFLFAALTFVFLWRLAQSTILLSPDQKPLWMKLPLRLGFLFLLAVAARGGFQKKVIKPVDAFAVGQSELGVLALNSGFTLLKSRTDLRLKPLHFFKSDEEVRAVLQQGPWEHPLPRTKSNVVLIIVESLALEFFQKHPPFESAVPFLSELAEKGIFFPNHFANGRRSIEALPSLLLSVPSLMSTPVVKSNYQSNFWRGLPAVLDENGYQTLFFHGAKKGTMYLVQMAQMAGVKKYFTKEDYVGARAHYDGHWGIYDGPFLQFMAKELDRTATPFFAAVFTISSHHPYTLPASHRDRFPDGPRKIYKSMRYVDESLRDFFSAIQRSPWFKDTLFVITGDHTPESRNSAHDTILGRYLSPLILYQPSARLPQIAKDRIVQHCDFYPSILDYLGITDLRRPLFGRSWFSKEPGEALIQSNGVHWLVSKNAVLEQAGNGSEVFMEYAAEKTSKQKLVFDEALQSEMSRRSKAYRQHYSTGLIENSFFREQAHWASKQKPKAP